MHAIELRPYQRAAADAVDAARSRGLRRVIVQLPTGAGKTVFAAVLAAERKARTLFLVHRDELVSQSLRTLRLCYPGATLGVVKGPEEDLRADVIVASIQTLARPARLERFLAGAGAFDLVVPDEAHHSVAASWARVLEALEVYEPLVVGLTATPNRADGVRLQGYWEEIVFRMTILDGIRGGFLCDVRGVRVKAPVNLDDVDTRSGDFAVGQLGHAMAHPRVLTTTINAYHAEAEGLRTLGFAANVEHAKVLASRFSASGITSEHIDGEMKLDVRRDKLARFRDGDLRVLFNYGVLTEGFDDPAIQCILLVRPTKSEALYIQMVGRGLRPAPGKEKCLLLDVSGDSSRHSLIQLGTLAGRAPSVEEIEAATGKKKLASVAAEVPRKIDSLLEWVQGTGDVDVESADLFAAAWGRRRFAWISTSFGHGLDLGAPDRGFLLLRKAKDKSGLFDVVRVYVDGWRGKFERLTDEPYSVDWATGLAEGAAKRFLEEKPDGRKKKNGAKWQERRADWREKPPSDGQARALQYRNLEIPKTRGEAAAILSRDSMDRDVAGFRKTDETRSIRSHLRKLFEEGKIPAADISEAWEIDALTDGDARRLRAMVYGRKRNGGANGSA